MVEMEGGSNRPIGVRGKPELRAAAYGTIGREVALKGEMVVEGGPSFDPRLVGGVPSTRWPVDESVGERGTVGKSEAEVCVVGREEFRGRGAVQWSWS